MKIKYFPDTDTLLVTFNDNPVAETADLSENALVDLDAHGRLVSLTLEHAARQTDVNDFSFQHAAAPGTA